MDARSTQPRLVGRVQELAALDDALDALADGAGSVVAIVGGPGLGKSRLLGELGARAEARRWIVLAGRASEFERDLPFAPLVDALDAYLAARADDLAPGLDPGIGRRLGAVFPALADAVDTPPADLPGERHRTHRAISALLARLAGERPLVLALDDLHWADDATLELVSHLVRHPMPVPLLLALGLRSRLVPAALRPAMSTVAGGRGGVHLELRALTREQSDEVLGSDLSVSLRDGIHEQSAGNPFFLEHLARAARLGGNGATPATASDLGQLGVPAAVEAALAVEVGRLPAAAVTVLRGAAVAGEPFTPSMVAAVCDIGQDGVLAALDALVAAALVVPTETPLNYRFAHPIVLRAVYRSAPGGWRIAAHARAERELQARGASAPARARHLEQAAAHGDEEAIAVLVAAADATAAMSPQACAHWIDAALRLVPDTEADRPRRLELLTRLAAVLAAAGQLDKSREALDRLGEELPAELVSLRAQVTIAGAKIDHLLGRHGAREALQAALDTLPAQVTADTVRLELELASDALLSGDFQAVNEWVGRACVHSDELDDPALAAAAEGLGARACYMMGDVPGAVARIDAAASGLDGLDDASAASHLEALAWFALSEACVERHGAAEAHVERARALARATGQGHLLPFLGIVRAFCALERGQLAHAAEEAGVASEEALLAGNAAFHCWALTMGCAAAAATGDVERALALGTQAVDVAGDDVVSALAHCYHGEALIAAGDPAAGRDAILAGAGGLLCDRIEPPFRPRWLALLAEAEVALGDLDAARAWVERAQAGAAASGLAGRETVAMRARALVEAAAGDTGAALVSVAAACDAGTRSGLALELGRALLLQGTVCERAGDQVAALASLRSAETALAGCRAWRLRDDAAAALRRLGHRTVTPRRGGHAVGEAVLSAREAEVVGLVARGRTNRQVAAELFVTQKTVETHLAHVFTKLGVSSRAAAAVAWERRDGGA